MVTILPALRQVREDLAGLLDRNEIKRICRELEYEWRERQLDPYTTLHPFILQVVNRNTAMTHLPHLCGERFTASAYCQARQRLPLELLQRLVDSFSRGLAKANPLSLWHGHRVALMDGSSFSMPDAPELQAYSGQPGQQRPGCGFPVAHMLALMDAHAGFLQDAIISPLRTHDMKHATDLHPNLRPGDIFVGDRGFCSYVHLAMLVRMNLHGVLRVHQKQIVSFHTHRPCVRGLPKGNTGIPTSRWVQRLSRCDQLVQWQKPKLPPKTGRKPSVDALSKSLAFPHPDRRQDAARIQQDRPSPSPLRSRPHVYFRTVVWSGSVPSSSPSMPSSTRTTFQPS